MDKLNKTFLLMLKDHEGFFMICTIAMCLYMVPRYQRCQPKPLSIGGRVDHITHSVICFKEFVDRLSVIHQG